MLSPRNPRRNSTKFGVCVTHMNGVCDGKLFLGALGRGHKVKYHSFQLQSQFQSFFISNFVCVLTNERYKTYQTGYSFCRLGHAPGVGLGAWVLRGSKQIFFFKHCHVAYQIDHISYLFWAIILSQKWCDKC